MRNIRLGVSIDNVATIRNAREATIPIRSGRRSPPWKPELRNHPPPAGGPQAPRGADLERLQASVSAPINLGWLPPRKWTRSPSGAGRRPSVSFQNDARK